MGSDQDTQTELIKAATSGDVDALQRLIVLNHGRLMSSLASRMDAGVRRVIDPEDVLQEAYAVAYRAIRECDFDGPVAFYAWLGAIAANQLKEARRYLHREKRDIARRHSSPRAADTSYGDMLDRLSGSALSPSRILGDNEAQAALISSLARLSDDRRRALHMRFFENRSIAETAEALGKSENAVCVLCHRALKELGRLMGSITEFLSRP